MASIGHIGVAVAVAANARIAAERWARVKLLLLLSALSMLPDADVIGFVLGVPYAAEWGHRGATHSLLFALAVAVLCVPLRFAMSRLEFFVLCWLTVTSHGLLDAMTTGGLGVALLWPFSTERFFFAWRPIPVAPIGIGMLSQRGWHVLVKETILFTPFWLAALLPWLWRKWRST